MGARDLLARLRAGEPPEAGALEAFAAGLADGTVSDAQAGAFAMAACLRGLGEEGCVALTRAMTRSGAVLDWDLPGPVLDKHSTGGVGDPVSLILAPTLAALGAYVPMISGRGLGHTGGTLDKLEAIPGLSVDLEEERLRAVVGDVGCVIAAASARIAPADRRLYAVRDVTGTVDDVTLITASILSKKLAAGIGALVLDVKVGSGAFMASEARARDLAGALVRTARGAGCRAEALLSDMDQPLARSVGNALEVGEVIAMLTKARPGMDLEAVSCALAGSLLEMSGMAGDVGQGAALAARTIASGAAAERFARMVAAMGGPSDLLERPAAHLAPAPVVREVTARDGGVVSAIDGAALGRCVVTLGGGRAREGDAIDPSVGLSEVVRLGEPVAPGAPLARIHAADEAGAARAVEEVRRAIAIGEGPARRRPLILGRIA